MENENKYEEVVTDVEDVEDVEVVEEADVDANADTAEGQQSNADDRPNDATQSSEDAHRQRVSRFAARFAALVAKGEQVMAALDARADAADESFGKKAAAADQRIDEFAAAMQERMEKVADQLAEDLEVIASAVDGPVVAEAEQKNDEQAEACDENPDNPDNPTEPAIDVPYRPQFTPAAQAFRERMRVGSASDLLLTDPEFVERFANFAFDDVPADVDLPDRTRFMCWLATLLGCQGIDEFRTLLPAALNVGVEPHTLKEIVYQAVAYLGIGRVYPFLKATNEALVAAGVELPLKPQATTLPNERSRYEGGEQAQVACFGEQMRGYKDRGAADYPHIAQWLVKNCFGDWYTRGGLTIAEREMCTFCFLAAQGGCEPQLKGHTAANVQCGNDREFLIKVVSNNVPFIGYPRTLNAMAVVEEVTGSKE